MNSTATPTGNAPATAIGLIRLMRPSQWLKNGIVLAPLVFGAEFTDMAVVASALLAMLLFCIASSATYIVNDYHDIEQDRRHPLKSVQRPLAAGHTSKRQALVLLCCLYGMLACGFFLQPAVVPAILAYLVLNLAYTYKLKHQPVIDIFTIAIG
ncbi:MAG: UbiA family prenyltransferase, partial [Pseudomonadales bacterium]